MKSAFASIIMTLALAGCGSSMSAGSGSTSPAYPDIAGAGGSLKTLQAGSVQVQTQSTNYLPQGGWLSSCMTSSGLASSGSSNINLIVQNNFIYIFTTIYSDTVASDGGCVAADVLYRTITYAEFDTEGTATSNANATAVNSGIQWVEVEPLSAAGASLLNADNGVGFCNMTNWASLFTQTVTGMSCISGSAAGTVTYSIFAASGSTTGSTLALGVTSGGNDGTTGAKRFSTLATTGTAPYDYFTKQ